MGITIDKNLCIGCGACAALCPENFAMDESEGKAEPRKDKETACVKNAIMSCPVQAISLG